MNAQFAPGKNRDRLLSVGMVSEADEFYRVAESPEAVRRALEDPWMREHVLARLPLDVEGKDWRWDEEHPDYGNLVEEMADDLLDFVDAHPEPELWAWQGAFGYVCVRHLFGPLASRPASFPAWCGELAATWADAGSPELPPRGEAGHHALEMARWARDADSIISLRESGSGMSGGHGELG